MMLAQERPYRSPRSPTSNQDRSCHMMPPPQRKMGSESLNSRTLMVSKHVPQSVLLPLTFEEPTRQNFPCNRFALRPRNEASSQQTPSGQTTARKSESLPVLVTPRCQNLNRAKRRREDESDSDIEEDEELCRLNFPKKLLLSFD
ncbi:unnamed protein product [Cylindrotheca closterium]|uniref:Uncharacterized protein n=1 Tax=Cylindrotheca closterium TaxID=2856 RepID=A0AAD2CXR9_9STRA|nr:unnamed protein product [Cylindrotheca closterium]